MSASQRLPRLGLVLLVGLSIAWGSNWWVMKVALQEIPPWTFRGYTCIAAGLMLLALARMAGVKARPHGGEWRSLAIASLFNVTSWHMFTAFGLILLPSGKASILGFTMPIWSAMLAAMFLGERLSGRLIVALALGIAGIVVLVSRSAGVLAESPIGVIFVLLAAFGWAIGTLYQKRQKWTISTLANAGWQLFFGGVPILIVMPFVEGLHFPQASWYAWACVLYLVLVALVFAYFAWFKIVHLFPANVAAVGTLLTPMVALVSSAIALGEPLGVRELLSMALVGSALALVLIFPPPKPASARA
ncbi:MAG TPA: EamA family transporter [Alphaproteobacteria bacterium]|nr:EamA family transporter [Alphaproteobacteria bacterium]